MTDPRTTDRRPTAADLSEAILSALNGDVLRAMQNDRFLSNREVSDLHWLMNALDSGAVMVHPDDHQLLGDPDLMGDYLRGVWWGHDEVIRDIFGDRAVHGSTPSDGGG